MSKKGKGKGKSKGSGKESRTTSKSQIRGGGFGGKNPFWYAMFVSFVVAIGAAIAATYYLIRAAMYSASMVGYEEYYGLYGFGLGLGSSYMWMYGIGYMITAIVALSLGFYFKKRAIIWR